MRQILFLHGCAYRLLLHQLLKRRIPRPEKGPQQSYIFIGTVPLPQILPPQPLI